jgi:hypothetical protein
MLSVKKLAAAAAITAAGIGVTAGPAAAQARQDGLVNVAVGDVTILEDVNIAAAVDAAVQACGIDVADVDAVAAVLGTAGLVDQSSRSLVVCRQEDGDKVRFVQN